MPTTHLRACDVPEVRQDLLRWAQQNAERGKRAQGAIHVNAFTEPSMFQSSAAAAELYYVNDVMTRLARDIGEGLPVCAFDVDSLPAPTGLLVWSDDSSAHTQNLGKPRAVLWCRTGLTLRVAVLDDAGPYRRELEKLGRRVDPTWASEVALSLAGDLALGFGTAIPLNVETDWDEVKHAWSVDRHGRPAKDRFHVGADRLNSIHGEQLGVIRTLLGTLLLIRQPAEARRALWQSDDVQPDAAARKRLRRAGAERPDATVRYITLRQNVRPLSDDAETSGRSARTYRSQWFVRPHRRTYPDRNDPTGYSRKWVGPYLVTPAGCESAPILGRERIVHVLRR
ncbi:hypothetical protein [Streptomyces xiamenensis]|uniref:hypothetical protein n=1 Tax=Streptomyces xiamenensis TaxID=408015 RepID=UPI0037D6E736